MSVTRLVTSLEAVKTRVTVPGAILVDLGCEDVTTGCGGGADGCGSVTLECCPGVEIPRILKARLSDPTFCYADSGIPAIVLLEHNPDLSVGEYWTTVIDWSGVASGTFRVFYDACTGALTADYGANYACFLTGGHTVSVNSHDCGRPHSAAGVSAHDTAGDPANDSTFNYVVEEV